MRTSFPVKRNSFGSRTAWLRPVWNSFALFSIVAIKSIPSPSIYQWYLLFALAQPGDHGEVFERRGVALHVAGSGEFAQETPHDLAASRLRQRLSKRQVIGPGKRANLLGDPLAQLLPQLFARLVAAFEGDEDGDRLPLHLVRTAHCGGFGHLGMGDKSRLDFHRGEPVAADVDDVVDASHETEVSIRSAARAVRGEVTTGNLAPVSLLVAGMIAVDGARHRGPGLTDHQQAALTIRNRLPRSCNHFRHNSKKGFRC